MSGTGLRAIRADEHLKDIAAEVEEGRRAEIRFGDATLVEVSRHFRGRHRAALGRGGGGEVNAASPSAAMSSPGK